MICRYVVHAKIPAYEALGWFNTQALLGTHHGHYSDLLEWRGDGEPVEPPPTPAPAPSGTTAHEEAGNA